MAFEEHIVNARRNSGREVPPAWYEIPVFYFTNPGAVYGDGDQIPKPPDTEMLDYELELACVLGAGGRPEGFTIMNDFSARDLQGLEMQVGLGPAKGKDFAISLGPWLVTPDELPYDDGRLRLEASVTLNGEQLTRGSAAEQHWSWPELVEHAGRDTRLRPGDVLGSGTLNRGCLLELNAEGGEQRWLQPGDIVTLAADGLGELTTQIEP
jgi:fumarylacetoacetate (FAA) hydrolase